MTATTLTKTTAPGYWSQTGTAVTMTAADVANGNDFVATGECLVIARNSGGSAYTVTITSQADPRYGRTGSVTAQSLAAGEIRVFRLMNEGWADSAGKINLSASNAAVYFGIVQL